MSNKFSKKEGEVNRSLKDGKVTDIHKKQREEFKEKIDQIKLALERLTELYKEIKE